ncbi:DNA cytosine methyltransferase [Puerhibacterium puerhi]|uniref:DNA cytosine methyltransferase n=1 Tax=Puerhibacterium puerhi TaxID=2692623 RepID=UPI001915A205|nr:DNA cytosine methyltransferase [Puerhibacterium puerhi]
MPNDRFTALSLFSGAGGLDVGLDRTGRFELLACVEIEQRFCETLVENRDAGRFGSDRTAIIQADISQLDPYALMDELHLKPGDLDLLVGGPPCQSWSTAGRRGTIQDPRGLLIWDYLKFVEALQPKYFLMENVRGLLSGALRHRPIALRPDKGGPPLSEEEQPGSAVAAWIDDLGKINNGAYRVDVYEVNAVNYGAPQLRERVLFIGNRFGDVVDFPKPTHGPSGSGLKPYATLGDAIKGFTEENPVLVDFSPRKKYYLSMVPTGGNWRALPESEAKASMGKAFYAKGGRSGWWRRLSWDLPCPTVTTLPNHSSTSMCHPEETRVLSVGEFSRVQEFPDGWTFCGAPAEQMKQVGNAVPVRLGVVAGEVVAQHLTRALSGAVATGSEVPPSRRVYLQSHVRTRQWWKDGKAVVRADVAGASAP